MVKLNEVAPDFKAQAFVKNQFKEIKLSDYKGKFVILFFYPADFTFVCPTELEDMADHYDKIKEYGEVLSISTDTHFVHKAWHDASEAIKKIKFPMVGDPLHVIAKAYNVLRDHEGLSDRATIIIDPDGIVKSIEITDEPIGRNAAELMRKLEALDHARKNPGMVCPAKWKPGDATLKAGIDLVGKI
ncbi:redoxin domain-containing protein [Candidatus Woesearchaeota archaeon]|nr:redoxin domain-containing protein [Candidatus Woesearchaeota archaeon]